MKMKNASLKKITSIGLYVFIALILPAQLVWSDEAKIEIVVGEWPPFISENEKHDGVVAHIISEVFAEMDVEAQFVFLPWGRAYKLASVGKYDATGVWMHKPEREVDFIYSDAILDERFVFFHKKSNDFEWETIDDLRGLKIGGGVKYSYGSLFDTAVENGTLYMERVASVEQNFAKLLNGRIDTFPEEINVGRSFLKKHFSLQDQDQITSHPKPLLINQSFVLFPKKLSSSVKLVERFNQQLKKFREVGLYDRFMNDYSIGKYTQEISTPSS